MTDFRKGHRVCHRDDRRRKGAVVSADVNRPGSIGHMAVAWGSGGYMTEMRPADLILDPDEPLRGRNVRAEHAIDNWQDFL